MVHDGTHGVARGHIMVHEDAHSIARGHIVVRRVT